MHAGSPPQAADRIDRGWANLTSDGQLRYGRAIPESTYERDEIREMGRHFNDGDANSFPQCTRVTVHTESTDQRKAPAA